MGSSFTNVHLRIPKGVDAKTFSERLRVYVERQLADEGYAVAADEPADREILIVPTKRWVAFYDPLTEDQSNRVEEWARNLSQELATETISVLVHDSDVLALGLFAAGKRRDAFDSNPAFSGKQPSKVTPEARAKKWASVVASGREGKLVEAFESRGLFAEGALPLVAFAIDADHATLGTGYNYLTHDGEVPANAVRVRARWAKRPPWEKRKSGAPRIASQWDGHAAPEQEPLRVLVGQPLHACAVATNRGGPARGLRIAIDAPSECIALMQVEVVIAKTGRFAADRHLVPLTCERGRFVAEFPGAQLQPGFDGRPDAIADAPLGAMMDANHAGEIHLNIHGTTRSAGAVTLAVEMIPLENPEGSHVVRVAIEVATPRAVPLRAKGELDPYELDGLASDAHTFLLVLLDARRDRVKSHALDLLASIRSLWPASGKWHAFAVDKRSESRELKMKNGVQAWPVLEEAIRTAKAQLSATLLPRSSYESEDACGFEVDVTEELGAISIWLARERTDRDAVERALAIAVDSIAKQGKLVQAVLARWLIQGSGPTPYESVIGLDGDHLAKRAWATRWLRGIGPGQLWLGPALRARMTVTLPGVVELGPAIRIPVTDVAATEAVLADLLPTADDGRAFEHEDD